MPNPYPKATFLYLLHELRKAERDFVIALAESLRIPLLVERVQNRLHLR